MYGIFQISDEQYNQIPALRSSVLKEMSKSALHARYAATTSKDTEALRFGTWVHHALLQPEMFKKQYHLLNEKIDRRTTVGKERHAELVMEFGEANIIGLEDSAELTAVVGGAWSNPGVKAILQSVSSVETSVVWNENGLDCKARIDAYSPQLNALIDIKTCQDASRDGFASAIYRFNYHVSAAHYLAGANSVKLADTLIDNFIFIAIEKKEPYASAAYILDIESLTVARTQREELMSKYKECLTANIWPGYLDKVQVISLPEWGMRKIEAMHGLEDNY